MPQSINSTCASSVTQLKVDYNPAQEVAEIRPELSQPFVTTVNESQDGIILKEWIYMGDESPQDMFYIKNIYSDQLYWRYALERSYNMRAVLQ